MKKHFSMKTRAFIMMLLIVLGICLSSCENAFDYRKKWVGKYHFVETIRDTVFVKEGDLYVNIVSDEDNKVELSLDNANAVFWICVVEEDGTIGGDVKTIAWIKGHFEKHKLYFIMKSISPGGASAIHQFDCKKVKDK